MATKVEFESHKDEVLAAMNSAAENALEAVGLAGEAYAKIEITKVVYDTPESKSGYIRTGRLRNSLTHAVDTNEMAVYIASDVEYAPYVEYGTSRMRARPFLKPAATEHTDEYTKIFESYLKGT